MTRVTAKIEINDELLILVNIYKPDMMAGHITYLKKTFSEGYK